MLSWCRDLGSGSNGTENRYKSLDESKFGSKLSFPSTPRIREPLIGAMQGPSGWGRSQPTVAPQRGPSSSTTCERICGKSRGCSATKTSAPPYVIPTSAMSRPGRRRKRQPGFGLKLNRFFQELGLPAASLKELWSPAQPAQGRAHSARGRAHTSGDKKSDSRMIERDVHRLVLSTRAISTAQATAACGKDCGAPSRRMLRTMFRLCPSFRRSGDRVPCLWRMRLTCQDLARGGRKGKYWTRLRVAAECCSR
jgi:hypothetical protein